MYILGIIIFIGILVWVFVDYKKVNKELRRCPNCNQVIKKEFSWKYSNKPISIPDNEGQKFNVTIYKCPNCGFSWNHSYEQSEHTS